MLKNPPTGREKWSIIIQKLLLILKLLWQYIIFFMFPTPEEYFYVAIGDIYFKLGLYKKTISSLEKSEKARHSSERAYAKYNWYYLGYSYLYLGNHSKALYYFDKYLSTANDSEIITLSGWCCIVLERWSDALTYYFKYLDHNPENPYLRIECAVAYWELKKKTEAMKQLEMAEKCSYSGNLKNIVESAKCYFNGNLEAGIELLEKVVSSESFNEYKGQYPAQADIYGFLVKLRREKGDRKGALLTLENAYSAYPDEWFANDLALEYADHGIKLPKALQLINDTLQSQPENSCFLDTKGWILFKINRRREAREILEKSLQLNPNSKETRQHYEEVVKNL